MDARIYLTSDAMHVTSDLAEIVALIKIALDASILSEVEQNIGRIITNRYGDLYLINIDHSEAELEVTVDTSEVIH